jgi:drug/metabolite transporter (DMT)-like permease
MPSVLVRTMLFLSSYFPLALIFFFLFVEQQPVWAIAILAIGVMGLVIMLLYFFYFAQRFAPIQDWAIISTKLRWRIAKKPIPSLRAGALGAAKPYT